MERTAIFDIAFLNAIIQLQTKTQQVKQSIENLNKDVLKKEQETGDAANLNYNHDTHTQNTIDITILHEKIKGQTKTLQATKKTLKEKFVEYNTFIEKQKNNTLSVVQLRKVS